jgi:hypothetical protein
MPGFITIKKVQPYQDAWLKYRWLEKTPGLCVAENLLHITAMAGKHLLFEIKRSKKNLAIDPDVALQIAKERRSFFTGKDHKLVAVIPKSACYEVTV